MSNFLAGAKAFFITLKNKVAEILGILIALIIAILTGLFIYEKTEKDADDALLKDNKTKDQIKDLDTDIQKNEDIQKAEQAKRDAITKDMENQANEKPTTDELLDYFNKPKSDS